MTTPVALAGLRVQCYRRRMDAATNYHDRIVRDPAIMGGEAVFKGTRVTLKTVLASLAEGASTAQVLADFPTLGEDDVRAAIAFAAASAQEDLPLIETPRRPHAS